MYEAKKQRSQSNKYAGENVWGIDDWRIESKSAPGYADDNGSNRSVGPRSPAVVVVKLPYQVS